MSWSIQVIGKAAALAEFVEDYDAKLTGDSAEEFRTVKPAILALLKANYRSPEYIARGARHPTLELIASGHGAKHEGQRAYHDCQISLKSFATYILPEPITEPEAAATKG